jgi:hypothetical protein
MSAVLPAQVQVDATPVALAAPCPIELRPGQHLNVLAPGYGETHVGDGALEILALLVEAHPHGLTARELNDRTGSADARAELKNLRLYNEVLKHLLVPPARRPGHPGRPRGESGRWRLAAPMTAPAAKDQARAS